MGPSLRAPGTGLDGLIALCVGDSRKPKRTGLLGVGVGKDESCFADCA